MSSYKDRFKPSINKSFLLIFAGIMWSAVGIMLISKAANWLYLYNGNPWFFVIVGLIAAIIIHRFGFSKIVDKNLVRILNLPEKPCAFSFISWKSYIIIAIMITMGIIMRHSPIPKQHLSTMYIAIGLALFISSTKYFRTLLVKN